MLFYKKCAFLIIVITNVSDKMISYVQIRESDDTKATYEAIHGELLSLCATLEEIADSLPSKIDKQACLHTAKNLPKIINRAQKFEEEDIFPLFERLKTPTLNFNSTLHRLKLEHVKDKYFAEEIAEVLISYSKDNPTLSAEATGYMLRGFFEALRRHIAFEHELFANIFTETLK